MDVFLESWAHGGVCSHGVCATISNSAVHCVQHTQHARSTCHAHTHNMHNTQRPCRRSRTSLVVSSMQPHMLRTFLKANSQHRPTKAPQLRPIHRSRRSFARCLYLPYAAAIISSSLLSWQMLADGTSNDYYPLFAKLKQFCDDDYDLVFSCSFGFMSQTSDVSSNYEPCRVGAHGGIMQCLESLVVSRASRDHLPRYLHVPRGRQPHNTFRAYRWPPNQRTHFHHIRQGLSNAFPRGDCCWRRPLSTIRHPLRQCTRQHMRGLCGGVPNSGGPARHQCICPGL
jgi:hypothetical protein